MKETDEEEERKISNSILAVMLSAPTTDGSYDFKQPEGKDEELEGAEVKQRIADHIYELQRKDPEWKKIIDKMDKSGAERYKNFIYREDSLII